MRRLAPLAAALLATLPGIANAAVPCVTAGEFASLTQFALPAMIDGARERCAPTLAPDAFLVRSGPSLAARYAADRTSWPQAKAAFLKLSDTGDRDANAMLSLMPDDAMQKTVLGVVEGLVVSQLPLSDCARVDRAVGLLSPLPAGNIAGLVAMLVQLGADAGKTPKLGPLRICPT